MISDEQISDLYYQVLGVRLQEFDSPAVHGFVRAAERMIRADERRQIDALKMLVKSQRDQLTHHRALAEKRMEAIGSLDSEREANARLTKELESARSDEREACALLAESLFKDRIFTAEHAGIFAAVAQTLAEHIRARAAND